MLVTEVLFLLSGARLLRLQWMTLKREGQTATYGPREQIPRCSSITHP